MSTSLENFHEMLAEFLRGMIRIPAVLLAALILLLNGTSKPRKFQAEQFAFAILVRNKEVFDRLSEM